MASDIVTVFVGHGLPGAITLVAMWWAWRKDKESRKLQTDFTERQERMVKEHKKQLDDMSQRYITKAETWMEKYHDLAHAQTSVLEALERRFDRRT